MLMSPQSAVLNLSVGSGEPNRKEASTFLHPWPPKINIASRLPLLKLHIKPCHANLSTAGSAMRVDLGTKSTGILAVTIKARSSTNEIFGSWMSCIAMPHSSCKSKARSPLHAMVVSKFSHSIAALTLLSTFATKKLKRISPKTSPGLDPR